MQEHPAQADLPTTVSPSCQPPLLTPKLSSACSTTSSVVRRAREQGGFSGTRGSRAMESILPLLTGKGGACWCEVLLWNILGSVPRLDSSHPEAHMLKHMLKSCP